MIGLAVLSAVAFHGLSVYSPHKAPMMTRPKCTPMVTMVETASSRSRRLNREAFNTRNMAIDERQAYEALMEKRAADSGRRNAIFGLLAVGGRVRGNADRDRRWHHPSAARPLLRTATRTRSPGRWLAIGGVGVRGELRELRRKLRPAGGAHRVRESLRLWSSRLQAA